jgi:hypothetical protein
VPEVTPDNTAKDVTADVVATLGALTVSARPVFAKVITVDDVETFRRIADPLAGTVAGVVSRPPRRGPGSDNSQERVERLDLDVCFVVAVSRKPGGEEREAAEEMQRLASLVRAGLALDITRGGRCHAVRWGGSLLDRTELGGAPRLVAPRPNQSFYVAVFPVACAWSVPRS